MWSLVLVDFNSVAFVVWHPFKSGVVSYWYKLSGSLPSLILTFLRSAASSFPQHCLKTLPCHQWLWGPTSPILLNIACPHFVGLSPLEFCIFPPCPGEQMWSGWMCEVWSSVRFCTVAEKPLLPCLALVISCFSFFPSLPLDFADR